MILQGAKVTEMMRSLWNHRKLIVLCSIGVIILLFLKITSYAQNKSEILAQVTAACDGVSGLAVNGQRAKISVKEGLEVEAQSDNSIEIKKDGLLLEKIEQYTADDRQRCIDSLLNFYAGTGNPLLDAAGASNGDYSNYLDDIKVAFLGFDPNNSSEYSGINHLVFSFQNRAPIKANIYGSDGCVFSKWKFFSRDKLYQVTKSAFLSQNGPTIISVEPGETKEISYELGTFNPPAYGAENNIDSTCNFLVGFGSQALAHTITATANSPIN